MIVKESTKIELCDLYLDINGVVMLYYVMYDSYWCVCPYLS